MINSRAKGARAEREAAKEVSRVLGVEARRGQQFSGGKESPDIITSLKDVHFEVKHVKALNLEAAYAQATRDAVTKLPVVLHKKDRGEWMLTLRLDDIWRLFNELSALRCKK